MFTIDRLGAVALAVVLLTAVSGCGGGGSPGVTASSNFALQTTNSELATRAVQALGAEQGTGDAVHLWVTVNEIRAIPKGGPPQRVSQDDQTLDLLDLGQMGSVVIAEAGLDEGEYVKLELIVADASIEFADESTAPVTVPSGEQTGIKLPIKFTIEDGYDTVLELDWNTGNSVHCTGNGQWILRPTALVVTDIGQQETVDQVEVSGESQVTDQDLLTPGQQDVAMLKLVFTVQDNFATIDGLTLALTGTALDSDIENVSVWVDDSDEAFEPPTDDPLIASGTYVDGTLELGFDPPQQFNAEGPLVLWVSYDIAEGATLGNTVGVSLTDVSSPDEISGLPVSSQEATIQSAA